MPLEIKFNRLRIKSTDSKLIFIPTIDQRPGFHYTLGLYEAKALLDLHATTPLDDGTKNYVSLEKIRVSDLNSAIESLSNNLGAFQIKIRKLRLGWLRKNGFYVITSKFLPERLFAEKRKYDFSSEGLRRFTEQLSAFTSRMLFDPQILWRLRADEFAEQPLYLINGRTGRYIYYRACDIHGKRYIYSMTFKTQSGKTIAAQTAILRAGEGLFEMLGNFFTKAEAINIGE